MVQRHPKRSDQEWMELIQECRTSGLTDKAWCERNHIQRSSLYYHIRRFRNMACEIPDNPVSSCQVQIPLHRITDSASNGSVFPVVTEHSSCQEQHEVVAVDFSVPAESEITEQPRNETVAYAPAIRVIYSGFSVEIQNTAASETIRNTITALRQLC